MNEMGRIIFAFISPCREKLVVDHERIYALEDSCQHFGMF
jgi:hypothetical protein